MIRGLHRRFVCAVVGCDVPRSSLRRTAEKTTGECRRCRRIFVLWQRP